MTFLRVFIGTLGALLPAAVQAQVTSTVNQVAPMLPTFGVNCAGVGCGLVLAQQAIAELDYIVIPIALIVITYSALRLLTNSDEEQLTKAKKTIGTAVAGIALVILLPQIFNAFYGPGGSAWLAGGTGAAILCTEFLGFFRWVEVVVAAVAVTIIIASGIRAVASWGGEDQITQMRRTIIGVAAGLIVLVNKYVFAVAFGIGECTLVNPSIGLAINRGIQVLNAIMVLLAVLTVAVVVYAGVMMILSIGREDAFGRARGLLGRALVGGVVVLVSFVIINFVFANIGS